MLVWIGIRESDIASSTELFDISITYFGSNCADNIAFCHEENARLNHNEESEGFISFCGEKLSEIIESNPEAKVLFYNSRMAALLPAHFQQHFICVNEQGILAYLDNKIAMRKMLSDLVDVVPYIHTKYLTRNSALSIVAGESIVVQERFSSGGHGTHLLRREDIETLGEEHRSDCMISPYYADALSANIQLMIGSDCIYVFPGSLQLTVELDGNILYLGSDFLSYSLLSARARENTQDAALNIAKKIMSLGYRGILGIDFLLQDEVPLFLEINPRFQASSSLIDRALKNQGLPSLYQMQIDAFSDISIIPPKMPRELTVSYSAVQYVAGTWNRPDLSFSEIAKSDEVVAVHPDGLSTGHQLSLGTYLFKVELNTNLFGYNFDKKITACENIIEVDSSLSRAISEGNPLIAKISLINRGLRFSEQALEFLRLAGGVKPGVYSSVDIEAFENLPINCAVDTPFAWLSPWAIRMQEENTWLTYRGNFVSQAKINSPDPLAALTTSNGARFDVYSFLATDRLRIHHARGCCFKNNSQGCVFCDVVPDHEPFVLEDVFEVWEKYLEEGDFRHVLVGGGSAYIEEEASDLLALVSRIHDDSKKDIYLMCTPPRCLKDLDKLIQAGVTEIAFNIELFDRNRAKLWMPGKGCISLKRYLEALAYATKLWGKTGNVRSVIIAGLEPMETLLAGVRMLCRMGVAPILSAFRPLPGTRASQLVAPRTSWLVEAYKRAQAICEEYGLRLGPACDKCQNNSLSMPVDSGY